MMKTCYDYSCKWRFEYNQSKCAVIVVNEQRCSRPERFWTLGRETIQEAELYTHLGMKCYRNMSSGALMCDASSMMRGTLNSNLHCGFNPAELNPITFQKNILT
ncbi:hypothetical protein DPMN_068736 [Dreissena polymorpha]|uniref:Uncharacterized protein n=1 Tax=Dreissena polymorpha TaxID=45954 RepID=A0A9D3Z301_DREPO|nr:hypothetical protein DPMN_068736 [Dreissena polymorpha]